MRIYEITQKKLTNEGILGGLASAVTKSLTTNVLGSGVSPAFSGTPLSSGERQAAGMAQSQALIGPMSTQAQKVWKQELKDMIAITPGALSVADLDATKIDIELRKLINQLTKEDTRKLINAINTDDPEIQDQKEILAQALDDASVEIIKQSQIKGTPELPAAWDKMATLIVQTQNVMANSKNQTQTIKPARITADSAGKPLFDGQPYNKNDPAHRATIKLSGQNPDTYVPGVATP
jgi:hypothetical protein